MSEEKNIEVLYKIESNEYLGRYLVSTRDISPGEIIIYEGPLLTCPSDSWKDDSLNRCLTCATEMDQNLEYSRCSKCYFPCCSKECQENPIHADFECRIFRLSKINFPPPYTYQVLNKSIMVLRGLILKSMDPDRWSQLCEMESHVDVRRNKPNISSIDDKIIANIRFFYGNMDTNLLPSVDEIRKMSGIIDVNAHLLPQRINGVSCEAGICHIFPKTSLLSHSCVPNAAWAVSRESDSVLITRASIDIPKGSEICVSYDVGEILFGTIRRLIPNEITGLFICKCKRCLDPTELNTHLSTLVCRNCHIGHFLPITPTDSFSDWKCNKCSHTESDENVLDLLERLELEIGFPKHNLLFSTKDEPIKNLEDFKNLYSGTVLHPNHYILQEVKIRIIKQKSKIIEFISENELIGSYITTCEELLDILGIIMPGASEFTAIINFHLCQGFHQLVIRFKREPIQVFVERIQTLAEVALEYFIANFGFQVYTVKLQSILEDVKDSLESTKL